MSCDEVQELLRLNDWTPTQLAVELDMSASAISRWLNENRVPRGPAAILMRQWLDKARKHAAVSA